MESIGALEDNPAPTFSPNMPFGMDNTPQVFTDYLIPLGNAPVATEPSFLERMLTPVLGPVNPYQPPPASSASPVYPVVKVEESKVVNPVYGQTEKTNWMIYAAIAIAAVVAVKALGRKRK